MFSGQVNSKFNSMVIQSTLTLATLHDGQPIQIKWLKPNLNEIGWCLKFDQGLPSIQLNINKNIK